MKTIKKNYLVFSFNRYAIKGIRLLQPGNNAILIENCCNVRYVDLVLLANAYIAVFEATEPNNV
jgi:hypothetical protein